MTNKFLSKGTTLQSEPGPLARVDYVSPDEGILAGAYPRIVFQSLKLLTWLKPMALINLALQGQVAYNLGTDPLSYRCFQGTLAVVALQASFTDYSV
jgi:hypothetical protein